jgi:hypothetical protein
MVMALAETFDSPTRPVLREVSDPAEPGPWWPRAWTSRRPRRCLGTPAQLTLGLYAQAVVSLGAAAAESMAARFQLPGPTRDRRAMEAGSEASEESDDDDA